MTYKTITPAQFLAEARAWDIKRRAMRRAAFFASIFNTFMAAFALAFIALTCTTIAAPFVLAAAAFLGIPLH
ncbi:hypothetical protein [Thiomonas sp. X19]|uniref:hypothetical protein n=1 Tax=Thiomonas sp. X19 TaxID=1050370 RepID=UPI0011BEBC29|nr:hypothetical protein [Thiomonas sp. X19]